MNWRDHIDTDPEILGGKPAIRGTRIAVEIVLGWLGQGWSVEQLLEAYPRLARSDVQAAQAFAADMIRDERYAAIGKAAA
jgi:uncharacterized protein (DUF433 family)